MLVLPDEINLTRDYKYNDDFKLTTGVFINKDITINGNGHNISGENQAMSLYIPNDVYKVTLNNITFVNGKSVIDQEKCIKCGTCMQICPVGAITDED